MNNEVPVLACSKVAKTFKEGKLKVEVLKDIHFSLEQGEQVAIIGASGEGKSTLLHILGGLDSASQGEVLVAGTKINGLSEKQRSRLRNQYLGFVYQFHHLLPEFTVLENVCMPLLIRKEKPAVAKDKARALLDKVGLGKRLSHKLSELSGGERQHTAVVRALASDPSCVLADEPTGNLDHNTAEVVYEMMLSLNQDLGTSFLIVTHDLQLAQRMDRILVLEDGVLKDFVA